ncbi:MAG TPA: RNA polymerase factor sigma-54 [Candidatus Marinimicrobia bacterium]|jgi:RNA polymerase sigma-54 factor|nr:RNA polymerase factor sigma-54 [Candidatus Neomarinimicrobiota bacterium]HIB03621.1 RNA polymerase factor sigma-54 [Candidatus Neomarinimicrobiota bacterium]HIB71106.1 RNA polymerase factor sigma-54 [Candidatus Neomarinimicrobiota bacterium]HIB95968.1 RNA polymerase factor sigma-54 [Candidatus Neomarinimicrobiota bacterium]HIN62842.1 RNA polymerase sigma-54 factor [Candidatus Neomarinimicrobiota bacterium]
MSKLSQTLEQRQKLSPQQILQTVLLQMNSVDLEERIYKELEENPALEISDPEQTESDSESEESKEDVDWDEILNSEDEERTEGPYDRSKKEREVPIMEVLTPVERLLEHIDLLDISSTDRAIAKSIIWNIDEQGYLGTEIDLIADRLDAEVSDVKQMLRIVQRMEPPGIAARDLQECLAVQLELSGDNDLAYKIITEKFEDFANRRFERLKEELTCNRDELQEAFDVISRLNPKPGEGSPTSDADYILPDLLVEEVDGKLLVSVNDGNLPDIRLSSLYGNLLKAKNGNSSDVKIFLKKKVESAKWFVLAVQQRQLTMIKVMNAIINRQDAFFSGDTSTLRPMILKNIADAIEMDISTVSRVTRGKYVQTPWGVFELKHFFSEGMTTESGEEVSTKLVKDVLKKIIDSENKGHPNSDDKLAEMMKEKGYLIARRTVAKYREKLKIPVARLRRALP